MIIQHCKRPGIITEKLGVPVKEDARINERKTGLDGKPDSVFLEMAKDDYFHIRPPGGETFQEEKARVFSFLRDLLKKDYKAVLVVTHAEIVQVIRGYFKNLSDEEITGFHIPNCKLFKFEA